MKADKSRAKISESYMKLAHQQRQEAAQTRREDKRRADKERLMNEEDPEKARKLEVIDYVNLSMHGKKEEFGNLIPRKICFWRKIFPILIGNL